MNKFFCLEGLDGCGKSTQQELLKDKLAQAGYEVQCIRDPGGTRLSEKVREVLLDPEIDSVSDLSELLLYSASRAQLIEEIVKPALTEGKVLLADRFAWSTLAYQGYGRGISLELIKNLLDMTCGEFWPAHTYVLDIPVQEFRNRSDKQNRTADRIENENQIFFNKVREGYVSLSENYSENITLLNGVQNINDINQKIYEHILTQLEE